MSFDLGAVTLNSVLDLKGIEAGLKEAEKMAAGYSVKIGTALGKDIGAKQKITPQVDLSQLKALNAELSLKQRHLRQVREEFRRSPIKPRVDLSELKELSRLLNQIRSGSTGTLRVNVSGAAGSRSNQDIAGAVERGVERALSKFPEKIAKAIEDSLKKGPGSTLASVATAPLRAIGGIGSSVIQGAGFAIAGEVTKDFGKGLAEGLSDAASETIGSSELVGKKLAQGISRAFAKEIRSSFPQASGEIMAALQADLKDALGKEDVLVAGAARRRQTAQAAKQQRQAAFEQTVEERRETLRNLGGVQQRSAQLDQQYDQTTKQLIDAQRKYARLLEKVQQGLSAQEAAESINRRNQQELERYRKLAEKDAKYAPQVAELEAKAPVTAEGLSDLERFSATRRELGPLVEFAQARVAELQGQVREIVEAQQQVADFYRKGQQNLQALHQIRPKSNQPQTYQRIAQDVAQRSGFGQLAPEQMPQLVVTPGLKANAVYEDDSNRIRINESMAEALHQGQLTLEQATTLVHELRHAAQTGFGSAEGIAGAFNSQGQIEMIRASAEELQRFGGRIEASVAGGTGGTEQFRRERETDAYVFADRYAQDVLRSTGSNPLLQLSGQLEQPLKEYALSLKKLMAEAQQAGVDIKQDLVQAFAKSDAIQADIQQLRAQIAGANLLPDEEIVRLQDEIQRQIQRFRETLNEATGNISARIRGDLEPLEAPAGALATRGRPGGDGLGGALASTAENLKEGGQKVVSSLVTVTKAGYKLAQGIESLTLDLIPYGKLTKGVVQQVGLPAATFAAASQMGPAGQFITHGMQAVSHAGIDPIFGQVAGQVANQASQFIHSALPSGGGVVGRFGTQVANQFSGAAVQAITSAGQAIGAGVSEMVAVVLGGKLMSSAATKALQAAPGAVAKLPQLVPGTSAPSLPGTAEPVNIPVSLPERAMEIVSAATEAVANKAKADIQTAGEFVADAVSQGLKSGAEAAAQIGNDKLRDAVENLANKTRDMVDSAASGVQTITVAAEAIAEAPRLLTGKLPEGVDLQNLGTKQLEQLEKQLQGKLKAAQQAEAEGRAVLGGSGAIARDLETVQRLRQVASEPLLPPEVNQLVAEIKDSASEVQAKFRAAYQEFQAAVKEGDRRVATAYAQSIRGNIERARAEVTDLIQSLKEQGVDVSVGSELGNQLYALQGTYTKYEKGISRGLTKLPQTAATELEGEFGSQEVDLGNALSELTETVRRQTQRLKAYLKTPEGRSLIQDLAVNTAGFAASQLGGEAGIVGQLSGDVLGALAARQAIAMAQGGVAEGSALSGDILGWLVGNMTGMATGIPGSGAVAASVLVPQLNKLREATQGTGLESEFENLEVNLGGLLDEIVLFYLSIQKKLGAIPDLSPELQQEFDRIQQEMGATATAAPGYGESAADSIAKGEQAVAGFEQSAARFERVEAEIEARTDRLAYGLNQQPPLWQRFRAAIDDASTPLGRVGNLLRDVATSALALVGAFTLGDLLITLGRTTMGTAIELERLETSMDFATAGQGAENLARIRKESDDLGTSFREAAQGYQQFSAATLNTNLESQTEDIFAGFQQAMAARSLSAEQQNRANLALTQIASKPRISLEEVNQLNEAGLSGTLQAMSRATGKTTGELYKMAETGNLLTEDVLPKLSAQFGLEARSGVAAAAETAQAKLNRFNNALLQAQGAIGGFSLEAVKPVIDGATAGLKFFNENIRAVATGVEILSIFLGVKLVQGLTGLIVNGRVAAFVLKTLGLSGLSLQGILLNLGKTAAMVMRQLIVPAAIAGSIEVLFAYMNRGSEELRERNKSVAASVANIAAAYREAAEAAKELKDNSPQPARSNQELEAENPVLRFLDNTIIKPINRLQNFVRPNLAESNENFATEAQNRDLEETKKLTDSIQGSLKQSGFFLDDPKRLAEGVERLKEIDAQINSIQAAQSILRLEGSTEEVQRLQEALSQLQKDRKSVLANVLGSPADLETFKKDLEGAREDINKLVNSRAMTEQAAAPQLKIINELLVETERQMAAAESATKSVSEAFQNLALAAGKAAAAYENYQDASERSLSAVKTQILQQQAAGLLGENAARRATLQIEQQAYQDRLRQLQEFTRQQQAIIDSASESDRADLDLYLQQLFGKNLDSAGPGDIAQLKQLLGEQLTPNQQAILDARQRLLDLTKEIDSTSAQIAQGALDLTEQARQVQESARQLREQGLNLAREYQGFLRGIARQTAETSLEIKALTARLRSNDMKTALLRAITNGSQGIFQGFIDLAVSSIEQMQEEAEKQIELERQRAAARLEASRLTEQNRGFAQQESDYNRQRSQLEHSNAGSFYGNLNIGSGGSMPGGAGANIAGQAFTVWSTGPGGQSIEISRYGQSLQHHRQYAGFAGDVRDYTLERNRDNSTAMGLPYSTGFSGTVTQAGGGAYNTLRIETPNGEYVEFLHNKRVLVKLGQNVTAGMLVAEQGDAGSPGSTHVHLQGTRRLIQQTVDSWITGKYSGTVAQAASRAAQTVTASWYGPGFHGKQTASGEIFNENAMTAASNSLPMGTQVRLTNPKTGKSVVAKINDTGGFNELGRDIDVSREVARQLGFEGQGIANLQMEVLGGAGATGGGTISTVDPTKEAYDQAMAIGYNASRKKDFQSAIVNFQRALLLKPGDSKATEAIRNMAKSLNRPAAGYLKPSNVAPVNLPLGAGNAAIQQNLQTQLKAIGLQGQVAGQEREQGALQYRIQVNNQIRAKNDEIKQLGLDLRGLGEQMSDLYGQFQKESIANAIVQQAEGARRNLRDLQEQLENTSIKIQDQIRGAEQTVETLPGIIAQQRAAGRNDLADENQRLLDNAKSALPQLQDLLTKTREKHANLRAELETRVRFVLIEGLKKALEDLKDSRIEIQRSTEDLALQFKQLEALTGFKSPQLQEEEVRAGIRSQMQGFERSAQDQRRQVEREIENEGNQLKADANQYQQALASGDQELIEKWRTSVEERQQKLGDLREKLSAIIINLDRLPQVAERAEAFAVQQAQQQREFSRRDYLLGLEQQLLEAQANAPFADPYQMARDRGILETQLENLRFDKARVELEEMIVTLGLVPEEAEAARAALQRINDINLQNINNQANLLKTQIAEGVQGAIEGLIFDLGTSVDSVDSLLEAVSNFFGNLSQMFMRLAAQMIALQLTKLLFGGIGGGGLLGGLFAEGGTVPNFAQGGQVPNYANGGIAGPAALGLAIMAAMRKEGPKAVPIVASAGEEILSTRRGDAQLYRMLKNNGHWQRLKSENTFNIDTFAEGGTVGQLMARQGNPSRTAARGGSNVTISVPVTVEGNSDMAPEDAGRLGQAIKGAVQQEIMAQQRPGGILYGR